MQTMSVVTIFDANINTNNVNLGRNYGGNCRKVERISCFSVHFGSITLVFSSSDQTFLNDEANDMFGLISIWINEKLRLYY